MSDPTSPTPPATTPPASTPPVRIDSHGEALLGVLHCPAGPGPHPVVVLLHGFPGYERGFDLAQAFRRAGYAALVAHYRGSWGVGGSWSWAHVLEDAQAMVAAMRSPSMAATHRLDPERLAVVGHSVGGFAALMTAAADQGVSAVASVCGFDLSEMAKECVADPTERAAYVADFEPSLWPLSGTDMPTLLDEAIAAGPAWSLAATPPRLAGRPVLLIGGRRDTAAPAAVHHDPLVRAFQACPGSRLEQRVFPTDHALSDHRVELAATLLDFLDRHLGPHGRDG